MWVVGSCPRCSTDTNAYAALPVGPSTCGPGCRPLSKWSPVTISIRCRSDPPSMGRHGLLLRALNGWPRRLRGGRPERRAQFLCGCPKGRRETHRLFGRSRHRRGQPVRASAQPTGDGRAPAAVRRPGDRVSRLGHPRVRQPVLRADPCADRTIAGDDLPALGRDARPAGRDRRCRRVPHCGPRPPGRPGIERLRESAAPIACPTERSCASTRASVACAACSSLCRC